MQTDLKKQHIYFFFLFINLIGHLSNISAFFVSLFEEAMLTRNFHIHLYAIVIFKESILF